MRNPKKGKAKSPAKGKKEAKPPKVVETMETDAPSTSKVVWRPGIDPMGEDEELQYDPTAYDCYHGLQLDWPCLSFDVVRDDLGAPRSTFPHTVFMVAGTQAQTAKQNYVAFCKLAALGQGKHGKKAEKAESESDSEDDDDSMSGTDDEDDDSKEPPPRLHYRFVNHVGGINRIRSMPQQPGVVAVWGDTGSVKLLDGTGLLRELAGEEEVSAKGRNKVDLKPLHSHSHSSEGYAVDWSAKKAGRLVTGDGRGKIHVWEPQDGGRWQVSGSYPGHTSSVEDLQWSPSEDTVFMSCSADKTIRVWDVREKAKPMISVQAHESDVNVVSWNALVSYMLVSGADDGSLKVWDLRALSSEGGAVSTFAFHKAPVTSVEWCPYEGSMLASNSADNQLAIWDLALERDPEEEASLAPADNAEAPSDLPAQLLFLHAGQSDPKELHWHPQVPGLILTTAADGFNVFKPSNL